MLNRVLDKTIPPSAHVLALVDNAVGVLPELLGALRGEGMPKSDIGQIMDVSDKIAAGEEAWMRTGATQRTKTVKRIVRKLVPVVDDTPETETAVRRAQRPHTGRERVRHRPRLRHGHQRSIACGPESVR